jgi:hypothetical protein
MLKIIRTISYLMVSALVLGIVISGCGATITEPIAGLVTGSWSDPINNTDEGLLQCAKSAGLDKTHPMIVGRALDTTSGSGSGSRIVAVGLKPAPDSTGDGVIEFLGTAYSPGDVETVHTLAREWAAGTLDAYLTSTYPFDPEYQQSRGTDTEQEKDTDTGPTRPVCRVTTVHVRAPHGITVQTASLRSIDADETATVYALQTRHMFIPGVQAWPGSGYVSVASTIAHAWADNSRTNAVLDFAQPSEPYTGSTAILGTYHPSTRNQHNYVYRQSPPTTVTPSSHAATATWQVTLEPTTDSHTPVIVADESTPISFATIRNGYSGKHLVTATTTTQFSTTPLQPVGLATVIDESSLTHAIAFAPLLQGNRP